MCVFLVDDKVQNCFFEKFIYTYKTTFCVIFSSSKPKSAEMYFIFPYFLMRLVKHLIHNLPLQVLKA